MRTPGWKWRLRRTVGPGPGNAQPYPWFCFVGITFTSLQRSKPSILAKPAWSCWESVACCRLQWWSSTQPPELKPSDFRHGGRIGRLCRVLVWCAPEETHLSWLTPPHLKKWKITREMAEAAAQENMSKLMNSSMVAGFGGGRVDGGVEFLQQGFVHFCAGFGGVLDSILQLLQNFSVYLQPVLCSFHQTIVKFLQ